MPSRPAAGESAEMYLKSICELTEGGRRVPISALAGHLGISAISATEMVHRMQTRRLLDHTPYRGVRLTAAGRRRALQVIRRHRLWEQFLAGELGLPWEGVHDLACRLEHAVGQEVTEALARRLGQPEACPHGNPIPGSGGRLAASAGVGLDALAPGEGGVIRHIWPESGLLLEHLATRGLKPGVPVQVEAIDPFDGPRRLRAGTRRVDLGREAAARVFVQMPETAA